MREKRMTTYLLFVLLVAATVPSLVIGAYEFITVDRKYHSARESQHSRAVAVATEVSSYVSTHARAVRTLARQLQAVDNLGGVNLQAPLDLMREEYPGIVATFIGDSEGKALFFSPKQDLSGRVLAGRNYRDTWYFEPLMRTKAMVYSPVIPGAAVDQQPLVTMVAPMLDRQGNVQYYISGGLNLSMLGDHLAAHHRYPGEVMLLVDNQDTLIAQSGPADLPAFANLQDLPHLQRLRSGASWWEDKAELGGYATIPGLDWGVMIMTPRSPFYADLRNMLYASALTVAGALVLGWMMAWLLARTLNQPIAALMTAADEVHHGNMEARVISRGPLPREMAELHSSFNEMIEALQRYQGDLLHLNTTLEERVMERTHELAVLNETAAAVTGALDLRERLQQMARGIMHLLGADIGMVIINHSGLLEIEAVQAHHVSTRQSSRIAGDPGIGSHIIAENCPLIIDDLSDQRALFGDWADIYPHASFCGVPMRSAGKTVGALGAIRLQAGYFDRRSADLLATLAGQVGPAVASAWLYAEAQEQRNTLSGITNSMQDGLLLIDPEHRVKFANPAVRGLLGLDKLPEPGTFLDDFFGHWASDHPGVSFSLQPQESPGPAVSFGDLELPGPPARTVAATTFPVLGQGLTYQGYGLLLRDVTQERQVERMKEQIIANVSHELRTPLTTILGSASTLVNLRSVLDQDEQTEFLTGIVQESRRLKEIIDGLLDMSRIAGGGLALDRQPQPWSPLVTRAVKRAQQRWPDHRFEADLDPNLPMVAVDAVYAEHVLDNLLANAARYSPPDSQVVVSVCRKEAFLLTAVRDHGIGIAPEDLERVFERFYRCDDPQVRQVRGTGLGLAICRGIVEAHGGRIWAESTPGAGSTFSFSLPVAEPSAEGRREE